MMAGLSDKAIKTNYSENKYRYNSGSELQNKEFNDGTGLEMYEMAYRGLDPQLGRFTAIDPLANSTPYLSPYLFAGDKPESSNDPTGAKAEMIKKPGGNLAPGDGGGGYNGIGFTNIFGFGVDGVGTDDNDGGDDGGDDGGGGGGGGGGNAAGNGSAPITPAADYVNTMNSLGIPISSSDSYLATLIAQQTWAGQLTNATATLLPNGGFQINGTLPDGTPLPSPMTVGSDFVSTYLSSLPDAEGGSNEGEESNGLEMARTTLDAGIFAQDLTTNGTIGAQRLANAMSGTSNSILDLKALKLLKVGTLGSLTVEGAGQALGGLAVGLTLIDMRQNGVNWSNGTDLFFDGVAFIPGVGWAISGTYFLANMIVKGETNQSIGQYIGNMVNSSANLDIPSPFGGGSLVP